MAAAQERHMHEPVVGSLEERPRSLSALFRSRCEVQMGEATDGVERNESEDSLAEWIQKRETLRKPHPWRECVDYWSLCLFAAAIVATFLVIGCYLEGWNVLTCCYVLMQIVTTIGYGDVTPSTTSMKLFLCIYVLVALLVVAQFLNKFVQGLVDRSVNVFEDYLKSNIRPNYSHVRRKSRVNQYLGDHRDVVMSTLNLVTVTVIGAVFFDLVEPCTCSYGVSAACSSFDRHEDCAASGGYRKTWIDCMYLSVITVTTIGFGDYTPKSREGRFFAIIWCFIGVASCVNWLSTVTAWIFERQRWRSFDLEYMTLNEEVFREMDTEMNNTLSRHEFLSYALIKTGLVSSDIIRYLNEIFDELDSERTNAVTLEQMLHMQYWHNKRLGRKDLVEELLE